MPRMQFQKPRKIEWEVLSDQYGRLVAEPFEKGYALTIGNSLRRTLLSIVPGAAAAWVRIGGVGSREAKIPGVVESTEDVLLNLKRLVFNAASGEPRVVHMEVTGPKTVTGADVPEEGDLEILNPQHHLFVLEAGARVVLDIGVGVGRGYEAAEAKTTKVPAGALALDAAYSPIVRVSYNVEMSRLGKITDYEKLVVEIWTNGAVSPDEALTRAAGYMKGHFSPLATAEVGGVDEGENASGEEFLRDALAKPLEDLALPARALNALKAADLHVVADIVQKGESDLEHVKNLGEKSIEEIKGALAGLGLSLGMRIDPTLLGALDRGGAG